MTNPLDYTIQDPDAMRYALMQDSSYRGGGAVRMADGGILDGHPVFQTAQTPFAEYRHSIGMNQGGKHFDEGGQASQDRMRYELTNPYGTNYERFVPSTNAFSVNEKPASLAYTQHDVPIVTESGGIAPVPRTVHDDRLAEIEKQLDKGVKPEWMSGKDFLQDQAERKGYNTTDTSISALGQNVLAALGNSHILGGAFRALGAPYEAAEKVLGSSMGLDPMTGIIGKTGELHSIPKAGQYAASRAAPVLGKIDQVVRSGHESGLIPQPGMSIKDVTPKDNTIRLYHGSPDEKLTEVNEKGLFGGVFGSPNKQAAESHGEHLHYADISKDKLLSHHDLNYELPYEKVNEALLKARPDLRDNPELHEKVWNTVINDRGQNTHNLSDSDLMEMFHTSDAGEAGFDAQKLRGKISKNLGYHAVELEDEHGTTYLINSGTKLNKNGVAIEQPKVTPPKVLAPANEQGFYSPTEAAALNLQRKSGNGQAFLNDLMKGENVSSEEISGMGLDTFLKDKKNVTAAEVQDYIAQNKLGLGETTYQNKPNFINFLKQKGLSPEDAESMYYKAENRDPVADKFLNEYLDIKTPKFESYALPGGENYREVVLTLPTKTVSEAEARVILGAKPDAKLTEADINFASRKNAQEYQSSHFDEPNILAHLRMSDRVTDGKKTLLVDEVQSDWHQAARDVRTAEIKRLIDTYGVSKKDAQKAVPKDFGYTNPSKRSEIVRMLADEEPLTPAQERLRIAYLKGNTVPDAPYKEDWYQLALRRAIKEAIDGGYDRVALPTGARVAERFDLSKQADGVFWNPDKKELTVKTKDGDYAPIAVGISDQEVSKYVGKDVAKRLLSTDKENVYGVGNVHSLLGEDLTVGGEGMKKYYDEIYPTYLKNFGKKYGATVGKTTVDAGGVAEPLRYMDITPAMREAFKTGIHMKKGGKVSFASNVDAMRQELTKRH